MITYVKALLLVLPPPSPGPPGPPGVPIDNGLILLLFAALTLGAYYSYKKSKRNLMKK